MAFHLRRMARACALGLSLLVPAAAFAGTGDGGTSAAGVLRLAPRGAAAALGEAYVARSGVIEALHYNPGGLTRIGKAQIQMQHNDYLLDMKSDYAAGAFSAGRWTLGSSLLILDQGTFTRRTISNPAGTGRFSAGAQMLSFAVSRQFGERVSVGGAGRVFREKLDNISRTGESFDLGVHTIAIEDLLEFGAAIRNMGPAVKFDRDEENLPLDISLGLHVPRLFVRGLKVSTSLSFVRRQEPEFGAGIEYGVMNMAFLRFGYNSRNDLGSGLTAGLGFHVGGFQLDYAYVPFNDAGNSHRLSMTLAFGRPPRFEPQEPQAHDRNVHSAPRLSNDLAPTEPASVTHSRDVPPPAPPRADRDASVPRKVSGLPSGPDKAKEYADMARRFLRQGNYAQANFYAGAAEKMGYPDAGIILGQIDAAAKDEIHRHENAAKAKEYADMARRFLEQGNMIQAKFYATESQRFGNPDAGNLLSQISAAEAEQETSRKAEQSRRLAAAVAPSFRRPDDVQFMRDLSKAWEALALKKVAAARDFAAKAAAVTYDDAEKLLIEIDRAEKPETQDHPGIPIDAMLYLSSAWDLLSNGNAPLAELFASKALARGADGAIPIIRRVYRIQSESSAAAR